MAAEYDPRQTRAFYDAYGDAEWSRLEATAYGRLQAVIHADFIQQYVRQGHRVLDVGSGPGRFSIEIARLGAAVTVCDLSPGQLDMARQRINKAGLGSRVERYLAADVADLSEFEDGAFDVTVCFGGALSYVCGRRHQAAAELVRVTKPAGALLVSVMSRYGATAALARRPNLTALADPESAGIWTVLEHGDLAGFASRHVPTMPHPPMHLYDNAELRALFPTCETLAVAGSNVCTYEGAEQFEAVASDPSAWETVVELERQLSRIPGLVDSGSHIILAARTPTRV